MRARRPARGRSGITLVEILISILIMGIGVISIATLFPLGLLRIRNAQRLTRGAYLVDAAQNDLSTRNLLSATTFGYYSFTTSGASYTLNASVAPWYRTSASGAFNPLFQDTPSYGADWLTPVNNYPVNPSVNVPIGANIISPITGEVQGRGLPFAYDPLWRAVTGSYPNYLNGTGFEGRFGSGIDSPSGNTLLRSESNNRAHAHGLQRITNFPPSLTGNIAVQGVFISPEDIVLQESKGAYLDPNGNYNQLQDPSTVVPAMSDSPTGPLKSAPDVDWRYTWFFTGSVNDPSCTSVDGSIVVCENRPFAIDTLQGVSGPVRVASGETVVEAIWGASSAPNNTTYNSTTNQGYGSLSGSRSVYLRWPVGQTDPDVRVGGWIADVTYERVDNTARTHFANLYPPQRCYWYQIAKKTDVAVDSTGLRGMTVWTTTPLQAMTLQTFAAGSPAAPVHIEAALIMPSVINAYQSTITPR